MSYLSDLRHAVRLEHILDLALDVAEAQKLLGGRRLRGGADANATRARVAAAARRRDHRASFFSPLEKKWPLQDLKRPSFAQKQKKRKKKKKSKRRIAFRFYLCRFYLAAASS